MRAKSGLLWESRIGSVGAFQGEDACRKLWFHTTPTLLLLEPAFHNSVAPFGVQGFEKDLEIFSFR